MLNASILLRLVVLAVFLLPASVHAVQTATVREEAVVHASADPESEAIENVPAGTSIYASNKPTNGHYKVKAPSGKIGWIRAESLGLPAVLEAAPAAQSPPPPRRGRTTPQASRRADGGLPKFGVRLLGSLSLFKHENINTLYEITQLSNGFGLGGELLLRLSPQWAGVLRLERLGRSVEVEVATSGQIFLLASSATSIQLGMDYAFIDPTSDSSVAFNVAGLIGMGMSTELSSTAQGAAAPNVTTYSGSPLVFMIRTDFSVALSRSFSLGAQLGYRIHKLAAAAPTTVGATTSEDRLVTGGTYSPQEVSFSGLVLGAGLTLWF